MGIKKLTDRIYYLPHQQEVDRPMLSYIKGDKFSLAIDAGYSSSHVDDFYQSLKDTGLKNPDFTVITHWHYDHTFGMHHIKGLSIAHEKTNSFLKELQEMAKDALYINILKENDIYFKREYQGINEIKIVLSDIQFKNEIYIDLGGIGAQIFHTEAPHSEDSVCIYVPSEKILFLGDSVCGDYFNHGYMDRKKLYSLIKMIENTDCITCVLSHEEPLKKEELLNDLYGELNGI